MEENSLTPRKKWNLKALALLQIGLFEIFFVIITLLLIFGTLNYFNILYVSDVFPKYLSWLPKQTTQTKTASQGESLQPQNLSAVPKTSPTPTGYIDKATQDILVSFLPQILNPPLVPQSSKISLKQYKGTANSFNAAWDAKQPTANVIFTISQDKKSLESINLYLSKEDDSIPSTSSGKTLTSQFFSLIPKGTWGCKLLASKGVYCENFWQEPNGVKMGIGLQQPSIKSEDIRKKVIFFCQNTRDSSNYSWKSCSSEFADKGIQL